MMRRINDSKSVLDYINFAIAKKSVMDAVFSALVLS